MNWQTTHDDHTRNATIKQVIDYLTELASSDDPRILEAGIHWAADETAYGLENILIDLEDIRNALAHIDARNDDGDSQ